MRRRLGAVECQPSRRAAPVEGLAGPPDGARTPPDSSGLGRVGVGPVGPGPAEPRADLLEPTRGPVPVLSRPPAAPPPGTAEASGHPPGRIPMSTPPAMSAPGGRPPLASGGIVWTFRTRALTWRQPRPPPGVALRTIRAPPARVSPRACAGHSVRARRVDSFRPAEGPASSAALRNGRRRGAEMENRCRKIVRRGCRFRHCRNTVRKAITCDIGTVFLFSAGRKMFRGAPCNLRTKNAVPRAPGGEPGHQTRCPPHEHKSRAGGGVSRPPPAEGLRPTP